MSGPIPTVDNLEAVYGEQLTAADGSRYANLIASFLDLHGGGGAANMRSTDVESPPPYTHTPRV